MNVEKIYKRDDCKVKVIVSFTSDKSPHWIVRVYKTSSTRGVKYTSVVNTDSYIFRALNWAEREVFIKNKQLEYISEEEIRKLKFEVIEEIKKTI